MRGLYGPGAGARRDYSSKTPIWILIAGLVDSSAEATSQE